MKISVEVEVPNGGDYGCGKCVYSHDDTGLCELFRQYTVLEPCPECLAARKQAEHKEIDDACATEDYLNEEPEPVK